MIHYAKLGVVLMDRREGRQTDKEGEAGVLVPGVHVFSFSKGQLIGLIEAGAA